VHATASSAHDNDFCAFPVDNLASAAGPELVVPPQSTVHITFPQPFLTDAVAGTNVCLQAFGSGAFIGVKWSAVGYKILP
jgi:hypothetical protein